jgi:CheY-like chemotaxis protein
MEPPSSKRLKILIAEDDPNDRKLLALAAAQSKEIGELCVIADGEEVVEYLEGEGDFADRRAHPLPDVVVLDLKMPLMNGLEVLEWIRNQSTRPAMPVVMLSGSGLEKDVEEAYRLGADGYFQKPHSVAALKQVLRAITDYWAIAEWPRKRRDAVVF